MTFHVRSRWRGDESEPSVDRLRATLEELDANDDEHPDVALAHESEWCLSAFSSGLLIWENLEEDEPRHMNGVSRERVLALWSKLAQRRLDDIEAEPWLPLNRSQPLLVNCHVLSVRSLKAWAKRSTIHSRFGTGATSGSRRPVHAMNSF